MIVDRIKFKELCDEYEISFRIDYSGRFMCGNECVGIVGTARDLAVFYTRVLPSLYEGEEIPDEWTDGQSSDNMGRDMIYYWSGIEVGEQDPAQDDDDAHPLDVRYDNSDQN